MKKLGLVPIVLGVFTLAGCANPTPVAPAAAAGGASELSAKPSAGTPGVYTLTFMASVDGTLQEVTSLPVRTAELILKASVTSSTGSAAQAGTVTFEYCSYKGGPPNDISRADEAPKEACEQGTASWARLRSLYGSFRNVSGTRAWIRVHELRHRAPSPRCGVPLPLRVARQRHRQRDEPVEEFHLDGRIMKKLALVLLVCVVLPMQHAVIAQQARGLRIANDWCYPRVDDNGWTSIDICEVQIFDNSGETYIGGVSPAWSPDGLRIAYLAGGLYVYDRTTHTSALVTDGLPLSGPVSWSRDGAHLAFLGSFEGPSGWT